jgi:serine/threonine protein kinase
MIRATVGKYRIFREKKLGKGSFGEIYLGQNTQDGELVAIKVEKIRKGRDGMLQTEYKVMKHLSAASPTDPHLDALLFSSDGKTNYLVMNLLGENLEVLRKKNGGSFSLKTTLMISDQILRRLKSYHSANLIHRDIKPDNFMLDYKYPHKTLYLIDFGFAKEYRRDGVHIEEREETMDIGTPRYMSVNAHRCRSQSRRDDLISALYTILYLYAGSLPWQDCTDVETLKENLEIKDPNSFLRGFKEYCYELEFSEDIDYDYLLEMLRKSMQEEGWTVDYLWDWL